MTTATATRSRNASGSRHDERAARPRKDRGKAAKDDDKAAKDREKEKAAKAKAKEKERAAKQKEKEKAAKAREKAKAAKAREKAKAAKAKEREKAAKAKEKEKAAKAKAEEKDKAAKAEERERAAKAKARDRAKADTSEGKGKGNAGSRTAKDKGGTGSAGPDRTPAGTPKGRDASPAPEVHESGWIAEQLGKADAVTRSTKSPTLAASFTTRDHDIIRTWAESRGGTPADVRGTGDGVGSPGVLRIEFRDEQDRLEEVDWDGFFATFDESDVDFLYQEFTADGGESRFHKIVRAGD